MNTDDPIDKNRSDILIDILLIAHVEAVGLSQLFCRLHVLLDLPAVQADMVDVAEGGLVNLGHL